MRTFSTAKCLCMLKSANLGSHFWFVRISFVHLQQNCSRTMQNEKPAPFMAVHPGMMIKPELDERGISQKEFAKMLGTQPSHLSEVLNGKRALTTELAVKIENAIGLPAKILLSAQTQYELESTVEDNQHETVSVTIPVRDRNLLQELVRKFGWACVF